MNCPKCQMKMPFQERICRRCLYCPEIDSCISLEIARGKRGRETRQVAIYRKYMDYVVNHRICNQRQIRVRPGLRLFANIVPGLGQVISGHTGEGIFYLLAIPGLVIYVLFSGLSASTCMPILGAAFGLHILSFMRLTAVVDLGLMSRLATNLVCFIILGVLIYSPLADLLLTYKPEFTMAHNFNRPLDPWYFATIPFFIGTLIFAWVMGKFLSFVFSLPEGKRS